VNTPSTRDTLRQGMVWALLTLLILAAAAELGVRGIKRALSDTRDFAVVYTSTRAFAVGKNPYDESDLRATWLQATHNKPDDTNPLDLALYPPTTYLLLSPLAVMDWTRVRLAWLLINLSGVAVLGITLTRYAPWKLSPWKTACATAFILAFGPIHTAIAKGQMTVVVTAILALAIIAEARNAVVIAAALIGVAGSLKPQIAVPVVLLYLLQRRWKAIAVVAAVSAGLLCIAGLRLYWAGVSWVASLVHNVSLAAQPGGVYDPSPTNPLAFQLVNGSALLHRLTSNQAAVTIALATIGVFVCFFLWKRGVSCFDLLADPTAFATACVLGLVLIAHRYYDASVLVFVFVWALSAKGTAPATEPARRRIPAWIAIVGCLVMAFPIPALLMSSGHSRPPFAIPQALWDAGVIQQHSWVLLIVLFALTAALTDPSARPRAIVEDAR
jgi:Glycosyltransferase family 87